MKRLYCQNPLQVRETIYLETAQRHYLVNVLRCKKNDELIVFNGDGGEYRATITGISRRECELTIHHHEQKKTESPIKIHLGQGISKGDKMDVAIQKSVELGVTELTPLITDRCQLKLNEDTIQKRLAHWQNIIISACEQSGRSIIPTLHVPKTISTWLAQSHENGMVCDPNSQHGMKAFIQGNSKKRTTQTFSVLIGPEGGFTSQEIQDAVENHFQAVSLGPRILRTETAPLAIISILQHEYGDWS